MQALYVDWHYYIITHANMSGIFKLGVCAPEGPDGEVEAVPGGHDSLESAIPFTHCKKACAQLLSPAGVAVDDAPPAKRPVSDHKRHIKTSSHNKGLKCCFTDKD